MKRYLWLISTLLVLALALTGCTLKTTNLTTTTSTSTSQEGVLSASAASIEGVVESIYTKVNPSVVNIQVLLKATDSSSSTPDAQQQYTSALGSGFVWDTEGNIVTNNHVISDADKISVTFYDGTTVTASLVGADPDSDLAVIKVDTSAQQLQPVEMADSTQLKVGQLAIAIGNPFGLQGTMTVGFVSGLGRLLPSDENALGLAYSIPDVIQTDASINPGNSGGVLLDDTGKVIGVTSAIMTDTGTSAGVGFAIPSAIVLKVVPDLIKIGHYVHPWLGVSIVSLNPDLADAMNLKSGQRGALVMTVTSGSPADKAGLQASQSAVTINGEQVNAGGDVIIAFGDQVVKSSDDLITYLARSGSVGQTVSLTVLRDGKEVQVSVTLAARPSS